MEVGGLVEVLEETAWGTYKDIHGSDTRLLLLQILAANNQSFRLMFYRHISPSPKNGGGVYISGGVRFSQPGGGFWGVGVGVGYLPKAGGRSRLCRGPRRSAAQAPV